MIFNKSMLSGAVVVAEKESPLDTILLCKTGDVVACSNQAIYVSEPVKKETAEAMPFSPSEMTSDILVSAEQMDRLIKLIPQDRQFKGLLEHVDIDSVGNAVYYSKSEQIAKLKPRGKIHIAFSTWKERIRSFGKESIGIGDFVFNRKRLANVIKSIELSCKYDGEFAYIIQRPLSGGGYLWRSLNELTGQAVRIYFTLDKAANIEFNAWEKELTKQTFILRRKA